ncbi:MAG: hypothetical protein GX107_07450 [Clostridiales bacterium]|nr:hypothetical protein [Clostridiales bacterium]
MPRSAKIRLPIAAKIRKPYGSGGGTAIFSDGVACKTFRKECRHGDKGLLVL